MAEVKGTAGATHKFSAPGRVNLVGEHTDYTGGLVLPMAIPFSTVATIGPAADGRYTVTSTSFAGERTMAVDDRGPAVDDWSDYPVGVLREMQKLGIAVPPFALSLWGDVPLGSGLSSSASVEVATAVALLSHAGQTMPGADLALLCQRAENLYVESPCGIMDQFVIANATAGHALLLNTRDLSYELLPMNEGALAETRVVIVNSGVKHSVASGEYGVRRRELEEGQAVVRKRFPQVRDLGDATPEQLEACRADIHPVAFLRCRHVVTENARVREAGRAMVAGDAAALGRVMSAAHASYRDDFGASVEEVDFLVDTAVHLPGCYGGRLTGGGFGGCTVNLVQAEQVESFTKALHAAYQGRFGIDAAVYVCDAVDGAMARWANGDDGSR